MHNTLPGDFIEQMKKLLPDDYEQFLDKLDTPSPVSIRFNPAKVTMEALSYLPLKQQVPWNPHGYYLHNRPVFTLDSLFHAGAYYVQEASSMILYQVLQQAIPDNRPLRILDLCAAPGGKTTLIASWMPEGSLLIANEVIKSRVTILKQNLTRWGSPNVFICSYDPEAFLALQGWFDVVVVDAPCSGEGLFRKSPLSRQEWSAENVALCSARQRRILNVARQLVATGGTLVYSTCTYNSSENEENAHWLTEAWDMPSLQLEGLTEWNVADRRPGYQIYPHRAEGEGFYIAAFRQAGRILPDARKKKEFYKLTRLSKKEVQSIAHWFACPENLILLKSADGQIFYAPEPLLQDLLVLDYQLPSGIWLHEAGQIKGKDFIPAHELALAADILPAEYPSVELSEQDALLYLKKELVNLPADAPKGWITASYRNQRLGWIRNLGNRFNNYYPSGQRILKSLEE